MFHSMSQRIFDFVCLICLLLQTVNCLPFNYSIPTNYVPALILPEYAMLHHYARLLQSQTSSTTTRNNSEPASRSLGQLLDVEKAASESSPIRSTSPQPKPTIIPKSPSEAGLELKRINDRIILLLVFNNMLLDVIASLEDHQRELKDQLESKVPIGTPLAVPPKPPKDSMTAMASSLIPTVVTPATTDADHSTRLKVDVTKVTTTTTTTTVRPKLTLMRDETKQNNGRKRLATKPAQNSQSEDPHIPELPDSRIIYITDTNRLIGPELRRYIEALSDRKRFKVVFKSQPEIPNIENHRIDEPGLVKGSENSRELIPTIAMDDWKPVFPYRMIENRLRFNRVLDEDEVIMRK